MSDRKACPDRREAIAALAMHILAADEAAQLQEHLLHCPECMDLYNGLVRQEGDLQARFDQLARSVEVKPEVVSALDGAGLPDAGLRHSWPAPLRQIVRLAGSYPRAAVAAALVLGVIGWFSLSWRAGTDPLASPAQAAYVDVLRQITKAHSVRYIRHLQNEGRKPLVLHQAVLEGGRMRTEYPNGKIRIDDFRTGDNLMLYPEDKTATLTRFVYTDQKRLTNYVDWIQRLHERHALHIGREMIDGRCVDVYKADQPYEKITVWADSKTDLPVRIEQCLLPCVDKDIRVPQLGLGLSDFEAAGDKQPGSDQVPGVNLGVRGPGIVEFRSTSVFTDFVWNIDIDESLFSLTPPAGYEVQASMVRGQAASGSEALVAALRFWAENSDGCFPANINMLGDARPLLIRKYRGTGAPKQAYDNALQMMKTIVPGMYFAEELKLSDNWHYTGETVRLGEADKPLAWWLDKKTGLWQVVYGDLSIREVTADEKPRAA